MQDFYSVLVTRIFENVLSKAHTIRDAKELRNSLNNYALAVRLSSGIVLTHSVWVPETTFLVSRGRYASVYLSDYTDNFYEVYWRGSRRRTKVYAKSLVGRKIITLTIKSEYRDFYIDYEDLIP